MTYSPIELPPQEQTRAYVCEQCGCLVLSVRLHDGACAGSQPVSTPGDDDAREQPVTEPPAPDPRRQRPVGAARVTASQ